MFVTAVVAAAGRGIRLKSNTAKPLVKIGGRPILIWALKPLNKHPLIKEIVLVVNKEDLQEIEHNLRQYRIKKIKDIVLGGKRRQDSISNGLKSIDEHTDFVLIHDAARPFVDRQIISQTIIQAKKIGAAVAGVPLKPTVKLIDKRNNIIKTLRRDYLYEIQTPQVFKKELILKAFNKSGKAEVTDDSALVERLGVKVKIVKGSYSNIKITTPEDLIFAEAILESIRRKKKSVKPRCKT